jgi:hypothetical protein
MPENSVTPAQQVANLSAPAGPRGAWGCWPFAPHALNAAWRVELGVPEPAPG